MSRFGGSADWVNDWAHRAREIVAGTASRYGLAQDALIYLLDDDPQRLMDMRDDVQRRIDALPKIQAERLLGGLGDDDEQ